MKIHPRLTKFSSAYTKGTLAQRFALTDKINQKIFGNTVKLYQGKRKNYPVEIIEDCYNFCTPENKGIIISPLKECDEQDLAGGTKIMEKMGMYAGYVMELPVTKSDKLNIKSIPALMHESTHVLDFLLNPKFIRTEREFFETPLNKEFMTFYEKFFYNEAEENIKPEDTLNIAKHATSEFIKILPFKMKLIFLKFMRYSMQMEEHAYKQDYHYAKILKKLGKKVDKDDLSDFGRELMFAEKIKIVEKILADAIKEERNKIKEQIKAVQKLKKDLNSSCSTNV